MASGLAWRGTAVGVSGRPRDVHERGTRRVRAVFSARESVGAAREGQRALLMSGNGGAGAATGAAS